VVLCVLGRGPLRTCAGRDLAIVTTGAIGHFRRAATARVLVPRVLPDPDPKAHGTHTSCRGYHAPVLMGPAYGRIPRKDLRQIFRGSALPGGPQNHRGVAGRSRAGPPQRFRSLVA